MPFDLATPVFFHDAAITKEGCLLVWGGVRDIYSSNRTNIGQYCYLEPPSLKTLAALSLRPYINYKTVEEANNLRFSCVMEVVRVRRTDICVKDAFTLVRTSLFQFMALSLLSQNRCSFGGCQLYFSSTDDLIAHIEFTHIPPLEDEYRQKVSQAQGTEENRASATPNMPLSCVYRLRVINIGTLTMEFDCIVRRTDICVKDAFTLVRTSLFQFMALSLLSQNRCSFGGCQLYFSSTDDLIAHIEFTHIPPLEDEYRQKVSQAQGTEENRASATPNMPLSCVYRLHSRTTHGVILKESALSSHSSASGSRPSSHNGHPPPTASPTKYAAFDLLGGCGTPSSTDSAPASPSPAVLDQLISQARAHGQATAAAAQEQQRAQQRPLPVQIASTASHQYGQ
ncbi:zinc finger, C2H2 type, partial [Ostertagia ostertagi]